MKVDKFLYKSRNDEYMYINIYIFIYSYTYSYAEKYVTIYPLALKYILIFSDI
jgi:hypothetical protein